MQLRKPKMLENIDCRTSDGRTAQRIRDEDARANGLCTYRNCTERAEEGRVYPFKRTGDGGVCRWHWAEIDLWEADRGLRFATLGRCTGNTEEGQQCSRGQLHDSEKCFNHDARRLR